MKKVLVGAVGVLGAGLALAQSSVTVFGIIDASVRRVENSGGASVSQLASGAWATSRIGFRGVEDLGGGLKAGFWLESALLVDNGSSGTTSTNNQATGTTGGGGLTFGRRSTVSLMGNWGELRLGRDLVPQILTTTYFDPFFNLGVGASQTFNSLITGTTGVRASNGISYLTPAGPGFYGQFTYYLGENASNVANKNDGTGAGLRLGWTTKELEVSGTVSKTEYLVGDVKQNNLGATYDFGFAKLMGTYNWDRNAALRGRGFNVGAVVPVGPQEFKVAYSQYRIEGGATEPLARKISLGYGYNFSKRTTAYGVLARVNNSDGSTAVVALGAPAAVANRASTGFEIGLKHSF